MTVDIKPIMPEVPIDGLKEHIQKDYERVIAESACLQNEIVALNNEIIKQRLRADRLFDMLEKVIDIQHSIGI